MRKRIPVYNPETGTMTWGWSENEPAYARAAGTRGELVVGLSQRTQDRLNEQRLAKERSAEKIEAERAYQREWVKRKRATTCGARVHVSGEPCARKPGHRDNHASRAAMDREALRKRAA